jgi:hypothetical protein
MQMPQLSSRRSNKRGIARGSARGSARGRGLGPLRLGSSSEHSVRLPASSVALYEEVSSSERKGWNAQREQVPTNASPFLEPPAAEIRMAPGADQVGRTSAVGQQVAARLQVGGVKQRSACRVQQHSACSGLFRCATESHVDARPDKSACPPDDPYKADCIRTLRAWVKAGYEKPLVVNCNQQQLAFDVPGLVSREPDTRVGSRAAVSYSMDGEVGRCCAG